MYSCGPLHMDDQLEPTYSSTVPIRDVALRTYPKQWTIGRGGEKGSGISVLMAGHEERRIYFTKCKCIWKKHKSISPLPPAMSKYLCRLVSLAQEGQPIKEKEKFGFQNHKSAVWKTCRVVKHHTSVISSSKKSGWSLNYLCSLFTKLYLSK